MVEKKGNQKSRSQTQLAKENVQRDALHALDASSCPHHSTVQKLKPKSRSEAQPAKQHSERKALGALSFSAINVRNAAASPTTAEKKHPTAADTTGANNMPPLEDLLRGCGKYALENVVKGLCDLYVCRLKARTEEGAGNNGDGYREGGGSAEARKKVEREGVFQRLVGQRGRLIGRFDPPFEDVDEFECDGCGEDPIVGSYYHKVEDCDLCEGCYEKLGAEEKEEYALANDATPSGIAGGDLHASVEEFSCDGEGGTCGQDPIVGARFHKMEDYDLCSRCFETLDEDAKGDFRLVENPPSVLLMGENVRLDDLLRLCGKPSLADVVEGLRMLLRADTESMTGTDDQHVDVEVRAVVDLAIYNQQLRLQKERAALLCR
jgi:hypothetical protein